MTLAEMVAKYGEAEVVRFWAKVDIATDGGCWEWRGAKNRGYGSVSMNGKTRCAHRVSWEMDRGPVPLGLHVCHHCDNPGCVNPSHLFLATPKGNAEDRVRKGRSSHVAPIGEQNGSSKLTVEQVVEIRARYAEGGITQTALARDYPVCVRQISAVVRGENWGKLGAADA